MKIKLVLFLILGFAQSTAWAETVATALVLGAGNQASKITVNRAGQTLHMSSPAALEVGDRVSSTDNQTIVLKMREGSVVTLAPGTSLDVTQVAPLPSPQPSPLSTSTESTSTTEFRVPSGMVDFSAAKIYKGKNHFIVHTSEATLGVRGTEFLVEQEEKGVSLHTFRGSVEFSSTASPSNIVVVDAGNTSRLMSGKLVPSNPIRYNRKTFYSYLKKRSPGLVQQVSENRREANRTRQATPNRGATGAPIEAISKVAPTSASTKSKDEAEEEDSEKATPVGSGSNPPPHPKRRKTPPK